MAIKHQIEARAQACAREIRVALEKFVGEVGMPVKVEIEWANYHQLGEVANRPVVSSVTVDVASVKVRE